MGVRKTHEEFINELYLINPDIFKHYIFTEKYTGILTPMKLIGVHGEVMVSPSSLLQGSTPTIQSAIDKNIYFKNLANSVHKNKYNYDSVDYINAKTSVIINCPIHGNFKQVVSQHLRGNGCDKCGREFSADKRAMNLEYFINMSTEKHGDKYNYSNLNYNRNTDLVDIICPIHGTFKQKTSNHMRGQGCPSCHNVHFNIFSAFKYKDSYQNNDAILYVIYLSNEQESFYKIGITTKSVAHRFKKLKRYKYKEIKTIKDSLFNITILENYLHQLFSEYSYIPLNKFVGYTECFLEVDDELIEFAYSDLPNRIKLIEKEVTYVTKKN